MARQENTRQVNVNMTEEERQALDEFCERNGTSLNAAMKKAMELLLVDGLKVKSPELSGSIDDFILHINQLLNLYKVSIEHGLIADKRAQADVKGQLEGMAALAETNHNLQVALKRTTEQNEILEAKISEQTQAILELTLTVSDFKEKVKEAESHKATLIEAQMQNVELKQMIVDLKSNQADEIKKLQEEQYTKLMEFMKASK